MSNAANKTDTAKLLVEAEGCRVILNMAGDWQGTVRSWVADRVDAGHLWVGARVSLWQGVGPANSDLITCSGPSRAMTVPAAYRA